MKTLLEKALDAKVISKRRRQEPEEEFVDLAVAWARDEIGVSQAVQAIYGDTIQAGKGGGVYAHLARGLKKHLRAIEVGDNSVDSGENMTVE